jgi:DNA repair protein RecN (Recombination protein N)
MPASRFEVSFALEEDPDGWITLDGRRIKAFEEGMDKVEFYISTNSGEHPKPLARIASGGEVSRIMLALKTILARAEKFPILVFDEIDVGISGAVASKVAGSMYELSTSHQIIAITHLPQIAARGDVHFLVEKYVEDGRTKTRIRRLDEDYRAAHVASLMSGAEVGAAALETARELIGAARRGKGGG